MVILRILILILFIDFIAIQAVFAQGMPNLGGVAVNVEVADNEAEAGDILLISKDGLTRTETEYDVATYGVIVASPILSVEPRTDATKAVITSGIAEVKVSAADGAIEVGDFISSSGTLGVGQKATRSGYVLGKALEAYDSSDVGLIPVEVNIGFGDPTGTGAGTATGRIGELLSDPENFQLFLRYALAFIIAMATFIGATYAFVKFMTNGIVAIGRNPLAKKTIVGGMIINGLVIVVLAIGGFGIAAAIIGLWG